MSFIYELLRAGKTQTDSDSGAEVARKFNDNFAKVKSALSELEQSILDSKVKSSTLENEIFIKKDGTMEVNSLNVQKLVQTDQDYLILDGNI